MKTLLLMLVLSLSCGVVDNKEILHAIRMVECGDVENPPDGDNGNAIGHYQIWEAYWIDATQFDKTIGGTYEDCRNKDYAGKIVKAYMTRYCRKAWESSDAERISRIHNGGPKGYLKKATLPYWKKIQQILVKKVE